MKLLHKPFDYLDWFVAKELIEPKGFGCGWLKLSEESIENDRELRSLTGLVLNCLNISSSSVILPQSLYRFGWCAIIFYYDILL